MSLNRNIAASYASQLYVTTAAVILVPVYINYMGAEAYGLVGFFAMLQAWFTLLDMGLTPTMARETARYNGGAIDALSYRRFSRALEGVFAGVALSGGALLFVASDWISVYWLKPSRLPVEEISGALKLISVVVALRWICGLYRGVIIGHERLLWLSAFNASIATFRFVLIVPVLIFVSASPLTFFRFQLLVALVEVAGLAWLAYRLLPSVPGVGIVKWELAPLKSTLKFSLSIMLTSYVWVMVVQADRLVLSKILPLADYGYFTLAVLVAGGIYTMGQPISRAIMPRMTRLQAEGQHHQLITVYRKATQLAMVIAATLAIFLAFFSKQILWAWTGDAVLVEKAGPVLTLYSAGYGILTASAFPYYLQYANGDLKLHLLGTVLFFVLLIPSVVWAANYYGAVGAGWAWLITNSVYFMAWVPLVHRRFAPGLHWVWLLKDIVRPVSISLLCALVGFLFISWSGNRRILTMQLVAMGIFSLLTSYAVADRLKLIAWKPSRAS